MKIITFALRRSGSTAFWKIFDSNPGYFAYDEPFNPLLDQLPKEHPKHTWENFIRIYNHSPHQFQKVFSTIQKHEELSEELSASNEAYFKYLVQGKDNWFVDITRCHLKVKRLSEIFYDARAIHLYRKPIGFVTSHMMPSYGGWKAKRDKVLSKYFFWKKRFGFNAWSIEKIYQNWFFNVAKQLPLLGLRQSSLKVKTAHEKLLFYWLFHYRFMETYGKLAFEDRFHTLCFDELCHNPKSKMKSLIEDLGDDPAAFETSHLKPAKSGYQAGNIRWEISMKKTGFTDAEIKRWNQP